MCERDREGMGQCYGKAKLTVENDGSTNNNAITSSTTTIIASSNDRPQTPLPSSSASNGAVKSTPGRPSNHSSQSPWPSPYPHGVSASPLPGGVSPSPARGSATPRRFFRRPFPPPSPAKHIKASLAKRLGHGAKPKEGPIPEDRGAEPEQALDKSFGYSKNFGAKFELGREVGRGHFGHTCSARGKKGDLKDRPVAVKIISKAKVQNSHSLYAVVLISFTVCTYLWTLISVTFLHDRNKKAGIYSYLEQKYVVLLKITIMGIYIYIN